MASAIAQAPRQDRRAVAQGQHAAFLCLMRAVTIEQRAVAARPRATKVPEPSFAPVPEPRSEAAWTTTLLAAAAARGHELVQAGGGARCVRCMDWRRPARFAAFTEEDCVQLPELPHEAARKRAAEELRREEAAEREF